MTVPNPYTPARVDALPEEEGLARKAKEPVRTAIFAVLFVILIVGSVVFLSGFAGLLIAGILSAVLAAAYRLTTRTPKMINPAHTAGAQSCPDCGSVQTDQYVVSVDVLGWQCFACDHRWR